MHDFVALIPVFPGLSALFLALFGQKMSRAAVSVMACVSIFLSLLVSLGYLLLTLGFALPGFRALPIDTGSIFNFLEAGSLRIDMAFRLDSLSLVMCLVVTGVGFLIHVYSTGYMHHDPDYARFFTYLNLFTFAMLLLVLGANLVVLFIGWEGVGLCSYLLIGFWYEKKSASDAGKKAFIVNRIGDAGFMVGMMLLYANFGTLDIQSILGTVGESYPVGSHLLNVIALCLFIGATGKSAQIPLYIWLPDAMEGPTPVSALIHAATMVTSGVYMVARMAPLYSKATLVLALVAWVGALTAIVAASIGLVQNDIKRVLAYSTVSQLGYMFMACGVAAFDAAIFHVYTHAFFKALLFLGAGSVIHALSGEQDLRKMGGLSRKLTITTWTFVAATLAITGVPIVTSGFWSKDLILEKAFEANVWLWFIGILTAGMTSFYMFRLLYLAFYGSSRVDASVHPHESPPSMTVPLTLLAIGSIAAGWVAAPITRFLRDSILGGAEAEAAHAEAPHTAWGSEQILLASAAVFVMLVGLLLAYHLYIKEIGLPRRIAERWPRLYRLLSNKYYVDEIYGAAIVNPIVRGSDEVYRRFDLGVIDRTLDTIGAGAMESGRVIARLQTGNLKAYATYMLLGAAALVALWVL